MKSQRGKKWHQICLASSSSRRTQLLTDARAAQRLEIARPRESERGWRIENRPRRTPPFRSKWHLPCGPPTLRFGAATFLRASDPRDVLPTAVPPASFPGGPKAASIFPLPRGPDAGADFVPGWPRGSMFGLGQNHKRAEARKIKCKEPLLVVERGSSENRVEWDWG